MLDTFHPFLRGLIEGSGCATEAQLSGKMPPQVPSLWLNKKKDSMLGMVEEPEQVKCHINPLWQAMTGIYDVDYRLGTGSFLFEVLPH